MMSEYTVPKIHTSEKCESHNKNFTYIQWIKYAQLNEEKGIQQIQCEKCGHWFYPSESSSKKNILSNGGNHDGSECMYTLCYTKNPEIKDKCLGWCKSSLKDKNHL